MTSMRHSVRKGDVVALAGAGAASSAFRAEEFDRALVYVTGGATGRIVEMQASDDGGTTWFPYKRFTTGTLVAGLTAEGFLADPVPETFRYVNQTAGAGSTVDVSHELLKQPA